ncbi:hypothetical protein HQ584_08215 [Patescibacteria group bacterium]|nr:hypothetical protein [Patescibacteria group bacterium]
MKKCPDEKTLVRYLDYRLPSKQWDEVRGHCYFCDNCQKIVRVSAEAIKLRRNRLGSGPGEKNNQYAEALRLGLLLQPPHDPRFAKDADRLRVKALRKGTLYLRPEMNKKEYKKYLDRKARDKKITSLDLSQKRTLRSVLS